MVGRGTSGSKQELTLNLINAISQTMTDLGDSFNHIGLMPGGSMGADLTILRCLVNIGSI